MSHKIVTFRWGASHCSCSIDVYILREQDLGEIPTNAEGKKPPQMKENNSQDP
jgi:hypothetical protein